MMRSKKPKGKSPGTVERSKQRIVLELLPQDGSKRRWSDLEKEARDMKMSLRTLRKNLDKLERAGITAREVDTSKRPPGVYYRRSTEIRYAVGGHSYDVKTLMENVLMAFNKEINDLKKEHYKSANQKLGELLKFNINEVFRFMIMLFLRELIEQGPKRSLGKHNDMENFNRWMDVIARPRLETLLQLCIWHFDIAEPILEDINSYYQKMFIGDILGGS